MTFGYCFVLNCYYCLNGTRSRHVGQVPPTLEEYIPEDELLRPPSTVKLGGVWDYGEADAMNMEGVGDEV